MSIRSDEKNIIAARNREIAALKAEVERLSRAFAASNETNENLQDDLDFYRDLLCVCKTCQSSPCTGGCIVKRQAKIDVLEELLNYECPCPVEGRCRCNQPSLEWIAKTKLKQLKADQ
tara:strand:+ start:909 stop:1262 length:354 start_codon:yes stop_codon:yes gene_type:complete